LAKESLHLVSFVTIDSGSVPDYCENMNLWNGRSVEEWKRRWTTYVVSPMDNWWLRIFSMPAGEMEKQGRSANVY